MIPPTLAWQRNNPIMTSGVRGGKFSLDLRRKHDGQANGSGIRGDWLRLRVRFRLGEERGEVLVHGVNVETGHHLVFVDSRLHQGDFQRAAALSVPNESSLNALSIIPHGCQVERVKPHKEGGDSYRWIDGAYCWHGHAIARYLRTEQIRLSQKGASNVTCVGTLRAGCQRS